MELEQFKAMVHRLEQTSAASPGAYRVKVAGLAVLGFVILALLLGAVGFGLLVLAGIAAALLFTGGTALIVLLKFGKLLFLLAIPLWFLVKAGVQALFIRLPPPQGREVKPGEAPALFETLERMRSRMRGPRFHHVLLVDEVNAAVVQRPAWGLVGWPRNYLLLGLPLLESMPAAEALAVVAHEYGHLAGSHGRFSAFIYRLRHTWGVIQAFTDHVQGWLGRMVAPLVRWYAPYFNAYTFVLARSNEYHADAASAQLVGGAHAADALKRVNVVGSQHERFMQQTFDRIPHEPRPPQDLMQRWAGQARQPDATDTQRWLLDALDREASPWDTHPSLRARLQALAVVPDALDAAPPPVEGLTAAQEWFGDTLAALRTELQDRWATEVREPWETSHHDACKQRARLAQLREAEQRTVDEELEVLHLTHRLEPGTLLLEPVKAFNESHADHAAGLYLEARIRLDAGDRDGLALLDRTMALDPEATKPACERAYGFLMQQKDPAAAEVYAARWRERDEMEAVRDRQFQELTSDDTLVPAKLDEEAMGNVKALVESCPKDFVDELYLARRLIPADARAVQYLVGVRLSWWGRRRGKQQAVVDRLAALQWPLGVVVVSLDHQYEGLLDKFRAIEGARLA